MPIPLEVDIPKAHLPDILEVFVGLGDRDTFCGALPYEQANEAERHNWQKILACGPLKFVRKDPRMTTPDLEGMFAPTPPSGRP